MHRNGYCPLNCSIRCDSPTDILPIVEVIYDLSKCEIDLVTTGTCYKSAIKSPLHSLDIQVSEAGEGCSFTNSDIGVPNDCHCCVKYAYSNEYFSVLQIALLTSNSYCLFNRGTDRIINHACVGTNNVRET